METACSLCSGPSDVFCACTSPETVLCGQCNSLHAAKDTGKPHVTWPLDQLPYYHSPGYSQRLQTRRELFPQVRTQALLQVTLIDKAILEFTTEMQRALDALVQYRAHTLEKLYHMKEELCRETEAALGEVERALVEDQPRLASRYGNSFRRLTERLEPFEMFSYCIKTTSPWAVELHAFVHPPQQPALLFAALNENRLELYDLDTQRTAQHTLSANTRYAGCIQLDTHSVLAVGEEVLLLDLLTYQVTPLAPLLEHRYNPGVARLDKTVFAFGGWDSCALRHCEKYSLSDDCWTKLSDMHYARGAFTPCHFQALLYLAASYAADHRAVETFSPHSEVFTVLAVALPSHLKLLCGSTAFVANGELCLLTNERQMARWKVETEVEFRLSEIDRPCWSNQEPLVVGNQVFIASEGKVLQFSLDTYSFLTS